jgi:hypothetical protein
MTDDFAGLNIRQRKTKACGLTLIRKLAAVHFGRNAAAPRQGMNPQ